MKPLVKFTNNEMDYLTRSALRISVFGNASALQAQLEYRDDLPVAVMDIVKNCSDSMLDMCMQSFYLEDELGAKQHAYVAERRVTLDLQIENRSLQTKCAEQAKEIRNLKRSIDQMMK